MDTSSSSETSSPSEYTLRNVKIVSRKSRLALIQTNFIKDQIQAKSASTTVEIVTTDTLGDKILSKPLAKIGDKGLFTRELETSLTQSLTDLAVHSLKDLPTTLPKGLCLGCVPLRHDPRDVIVLNSKHLSILNSLISSNENSTNPSAEDILLKLPDNSIIGTSSLRRQSQIMYWASSNNRTYKFKDIRGNLDTRLAKLENEGFDVIILAAAGLDRMGKSHHGFFQTAMLYAVGQGALGIECRSNDSQLLTWLKTKMTHNPTLEKVTAERAFMKECNGGCHTPIGVKTTIFTEDGKTMLKLDASITHVNGKIQIKDTNSCILTDLEAAELLGKTLAQKMKSNGAADILAECKS